MHRAQTQRRACSAAFVVVLTCSTALCQTSASSKPSGPASREAFTPPAHPSANSRAPGLQELGLAFGTIDYTESNVDWHPYPGGTTSTQPFVTRGNWLEFDAEYLLARWFAVAANGRIGWEDRSPPTVPAEPLVPGQNTSRLDPQLGDSRVGGSVGAMVRFLPGRTALDVGATISFKSFRPRYGGDALNYSGNPCGDCETGQDTFTAMDVWPTFRVSRTGSGFFFSVGTGEGFVKTNEPGPFELLFGERASTFDLMAGVARGLALRVDGRIVPGVWLDVSGSFKPWGTSVSTSPATERWILVLGLTRRWSNFAPL